MIDKGIRYEDQKLTKKQKKKIKPANQGGGPNYLGKQKTVTVPKKWLSDPNHVVAELAYITPREKKILIDLDLYGSLNGKPNRGPAGIQSLQGDMGSVGGGSKSGNSSSSGGGGGGGGADASKPDFGKPSKPSKPSSPPSGGGGADASKPDFKPPSAPPSGGGGNVTEDDIREQYRLDNIITPDTVLEPERDTALERARLANIDLAKDLKNRPFQGVNVPPYIPFSGGINALGNLFGAFGYEFNKKHFQENVAGKKGYGYGYDDFKQYMQDRGLDKVDAYGNPVTRDRDGGGNINNNNISGIIENLIQPGIFPGEESPGGFKYIPYSNQVVIAPGIEGLRSLIGSNAFKSIIK